MSASSQASRAATSARSFAQRATMPKSFSSNTNKKPAKQVAMDERRLLERAACGGVTRWCARRPFPPSDSPRLGLAHRRAALSHGGVYRLGYLRNLHNRRPLPGLSLKAPSEMAGLSFLPALIDRIFLTAMCHTRWRKKSAQDRGRSTVRF